jgi:potassium-transporting ATPase potassium-binding subunit
VLHVFQIAFLPIVTVAIAVLLSIPTGRYLAWVMDGKFQAPSLLGWIERRLDTGTQNWKQYALALLGFNFVMFVFSYAVLALQPNLPLNPDGAKMLAPSTIFNTAISFLTNTNLQHYSGEQHLSYMSQILFVLWNMFVSAAVGFAAFSAMTRGLRGDKDMGNFYVDMFRVVALVFLPSAFVVSLLYMIAGTPMTFDGAAEVTTLEGVVQKIARGPVAALMSIKHLGTNGGGFFGANSAHPFENPDSWTNVLTCLAILIYPMSLVVAFGRMIGNPRHAAVIYSVMLVLFVGMIGWAIAWDTLEPNPAVTAHAPFLDSSGKQYSVVLEDGTTKKPLDMVPEMAGLPVDQKLGNLEGKELRFGTSAGATFSAVTTAVTCGSVNCMHDSLNPLAGLTPMTGMWLNCVFGGKGVGMINLLVYLITGVFLSGLMVGRTPEYLGKKVEAREMKLAMLALLVHPMLILGPTGLFSATDWGMKSTNNPGAHGFSEILYEFSSSSANNGSGFEGLGDTYGFADNDSPAPESIPWDIATGLVMLFGRFIPIIAPLALAAGLAAKKPTPYTAGTLRTDTVTFGFVLLGTILLVGALLFLPAAVLGPVAEHLGPMPFGG